MSLTKIIHAQIAADGGEAGARVRKNAQRNRHAGPVREKQTRRVEEDLEELKPVVVRRTRRKGSEAVEEHA